MTLQNIVTFDLLLYYDGKIKNWTKALRPTETQYYVEGDEIPEGKLVGDVKVQGNNGLISWAEWTKLTNMIGINGLKIKTGDAAAEAISADGSGNYTIDVSNKADKVSSPTAGHFAGLDAAGNLTDSGKAADDFATATQGGYADSALQNVTNGTDGSFVTTTIGSKTGENGSKTQTIAVAVTTGTPGSLANAEDANNGLVTAYDVQNYVNSRVSAGINYRGSVDNYTALQAIANPKAGDMYNVKNDETISGTLYPGDMNYVYVAAEGEDSEFWDPQSPTINISTCTLAQIDGLFA